MVFTYSEAITAWNTPPIFTEPGGIPIITFNGTDEEAVSPDLNYFSRDDASDEAFSIGFWINVTDSSSQRILFSKWDTREAIQEYRLSVSNTETFIMEIRDDSAGLDVSRVSSNEITLGSLTFLVFTYDGAGEAKAM